MEGPCVRVWRIARGIIVVVAVALFAYTAWATDHPTLGMCTGNDVRLRNEPSTGKGSKVIGKVNDFDMLILVGETSVDGETWYEVEHPKQGGTAWIFGKYVETDKGDAVGTLAYDMALRVRMTFGLTPQRARVLLGKAKKETTRKFWSEPAAQDFTETILEHDGFELRYVEDRLRHVEVRSGMMPFGDVRIGDAMHKVEDALGPPSSRGDEGWTYEVSPVEELLFEERDGKVTRMTWDWYMDA